MGGGNLGENLIIWIFIWEFYCLIIRLIIEIKRFKYKWIDPNKEFAHQLGMTPSREDE